jgi:hypothetical protein
MLQEGERRRKREKPTIFSAAGFNILNFHLSIKKRKKTQKFRITEKMAGFLPKQNKFCLKITGLPNHDKVEQPVYLSLRQSALNLPVKAIRRVVSTEHETEYKRAIIYVYLHRNEYRYVDNAAKAINDKEFEAKRRYTVKATTMEEKGLPWMYTDLQYDQGASVKLIMNGGRILEAQNQLFFGLKDAQQQATPAQQQQSSSAQQQQSSDEPETNEKFTG